MISIRPIADPDIEQICLMPQSSEELYSFFPRSTYPLTPDQVKSAVAQRSDSHVVEDDGVLLGFANFYRWGPDATCAIGNVIVSPMARGQGIATLLMNHMITLAYNRYHASEVTVSCFNFNVAGLLLYPKLGFVPYGIEERRGPYGEPVALIHMRHCKL